MSDDFMVTAPVTSLVIKPNQSKESIQIISALIKRIKGIEAVYTYSVGNTVCW